MKNYSYLILCLALIASHLLSAQQPFVLKGYQRGEIQWQSSPDGITWTNIENATQAEWNGMTPAGSELFYRAKVTDESCDPVYSETYKAGETSLKQLSFEKVELTDQFWSQRMKTQKERLVPIAFERTGNALEDLRRTAAYLKGDSSLLPSTSRYAISDLFKVMEGAAYLLKSNRDEALENQIDQIAAIIAGAQEKDGYLYPAHTTGVSKYAEHWGGAGMGDKPYSWVVHSHELYDVGTLYEAAVAYYQATGKTNLLNIAEKSAKHVNKVFFQGDPKYNNGKPVNQAPGHEEIELALVKLYQATHNSLYLEMAKKFIDIRGITYKPDGVGVMSPEYAQQHLPVREQMEAVGHAVRAAYLYSGMADVSACTNDKTLQPALHSIWENIVNTRMHITGGLGAIHGIEGFGPQYELPNAGAYNETCAAVGNVFANYRLFLMEKDGKYMDIAELSLLNNALAGVNIEGDKFFYVNPLEHNGLSPFNQGVNGRSSWFETACCPTNIARLIPQVTGLLYAYAGNDIYCPFYAGSKANIPLYSGTVTIEQSSDYPFDGNVSLKITPAENGQTFRLFMRIPTWATSSNVVPGNLYSYVNHPDAHWQLKVNDIEITPEIEKGFVSIERKWQAGDKVELILPMPVRFVHASDKVMADRGRIAVTRGPLVYCVEGIDNVNDVFSYFVDNPEVSPTVSIISTGILQGIPQLSFPAKSITQNDVGTAELKWIPYYAWNNRGASKMMVWLPETETLARDNFYVAPDFIENLQASYTYQNDDVNAIIDGLIPSGSGDTSIPRWTAWPQTGKNQWLEFTFNRPVDIAGAGIYWYNDNGGVQLPVSWNMEYFENNEWKPFPIIERSYPVSENRFNRVHSNTPIQAEKMKVNLTPKSSSSVGILEMQLKEAKGVIRYATASFTYERDDVEAIYDQKYPSNSADESIPRWTSWPELGMKQWVSFMLNKETDIQSFSVYWFQDSGGVQVPQSWNLEYKKDGVWTAFPVYVTDNYTTDRDKFNMVHPGESVLTKEIRLNMTARPSAGVGILEAIIEEVK